MSEILEDSGEQYVAPGKYVKVDGNWGQVGDIVQLSDYNFRWQILHTTTNDVCYLVSSVGGRKARVPNGFFTVIERLEGFTPTDNRPDYKVSSGEWGSEQ